MSWRAIAAVCGALAAIGCTTSWDHAFLVDAKVAAEEVPYNDTEWVESRARQLVREVAVQHGFSEAPEVAAHLPRHLLFEKDHHGQPMQIRLIRLETIVKREIPQKWTDPSPAGEGAVVEYEFASELASIRVVVTGDGDQRIRQYVRELAKGIGKALYESFGESAVGVLERVPPK